MRTATTFTKTTFAAATLGLTLASGIAFAQPAPEDATYLAIGDSLAYGFATVFTTPRTFGDRGYVAPFADWLATQNQGVRPAVITTAVPDETTASFFDGPAIGYIYNSNYSLFFPDTQAETVADRVGGQLAEGRTIRWISAQFGANDLLDLADESGFLNQPVLDQQTQAIAAIGEAITRYESILDSVVASLPEARLIVMGYYNPFPGSPANSLNDLAAFGAPILNTELASMAGRLGATFVPVFDIFVGREAELTFMDTDEDIHPEPLGYQLIAERMIEIAACPADFTGDGVLDFFDVLEYLALFDATDPAADLTGEGSLDFFDVLEFLARFDQGC